MAAEEKCLHEITEGKARVLFPDANTVFYNPVQEFNRDLSVAAIKQFTDLFAASCKKAVGLQIKNDGPKNVDKMSYSDEIERKIDDLKMKTDVNGTQILDSNTDGSLKILLKPQVKSNKPTTSEGDKGPHIELFEGLSATGLRSIRYALEIPRIDRIIANDLSPAAVDNIKRNIKHNHVEEKVEASLYDAGLLMHMHKHPASKRFQVIDLDPYGSPAIFLDGAVQAVDDGGLLCITCTDMAGLCGNHGEASFAKYGAMPLRSKNCHEMALRLVLGSIDSHAARYKRYIVPLLSVSIDFYIRVFVRVYTSALEVKRSASKKSYVFQCIGCDSFHLQPVGKNIEEGKSRKYNPATGPIVGEKCQECGQKFQIGGPIWSEPIHDKSFVESLLERIKADPQLYKTSQRLIGVSTVVSEELMDCPLYYVLDKLANIVHCHTPSMLQFRSAILSLGFSVSCSHANCNAVKTNAPNSVIWDILRNWEKLHPVSAKKRNGKSPGAAILSKEAKIECSFDILPEANPESRKQKISRFPENPQPEWGPKARAKGDSRFESLADKRRQMQGKKSKRKEEMKQVGLKQFPCKRYKQGVCEQDDGDCKYSHDQT